MAYNFNLGVADDGSVSAVTNNRDSSRTQIFTYDELDRVQTAKTSSATGPNAWGLSFGYDVYGNLLSATVTQGTATPLSVSVNGNNQIVGYTYDAAGNLTKDFSNTYQYDAEGRVKSAAGATYLYDGDGKRVEKSTGKLYWYGVNAAPLVETDGNGNNAVEYVFFNGARIARNTAGSVDYYFADELGSARVVTSSTGGILDDSDFYPFGGERSVVGPSSGNTYKFTGKERDTETGNDNFGARYYENIIGRFLSPDPGNTGADPNAPQSWNAYGYAGDNPTTNTDPTGEKYQVCQATMQDTNANCVTLSDEEFGQFEEENSKTLSFTGSGVIAQNGTEIGTFKQTSVDLNPGVGAALHQMGVVGQQGVIAGAEMVASNVVGSAVGAALGVVASNALSKLTDLPIFSDTKVAVNWVHNITGVRPSHFPPTGTQDEVTAAVTRAIQSGLYRVVPRGAFDNLIEGEVYINGQLNEFRGRLVGSIARISTVYQKVR